MTRGPAAAPMMAPETTTNTRPPTTRGTVTKWPQTARAHTEDSARNRAAADVNRAVRSRNGKNPFRSPEDIL